MCPAYLFYLLDTLNILGSVPKSFTVLSIIMCIYQKSMQVIKEFKKTRLAFGPFDLILFDTDTVTLNWLCSYITPNNDGKRLCLRNLHTLMRFVWPN